jgi:serine/threonine-protein kinase
MAHADRNLLFGVLALQLDFISRDQLIAALHAWVLDKAKPLGQILVEQGVLAAPTCSLLDTLVAKHLECHGQEPQRSLAALALPSQVRHDLDSITDTDLAASMAALPALPPWPRRDAAANPATPSLAGVRFRVLRLHAEGGLGKVSVARDDELDREVALKEIREYYSDDTTARSRFLREARITGGLEHPGIVPVYGLGAYPDGRPFYAMRFVQGESLAEAIGRFHEDGATQTPGERELALRRLLQHFIDVCNTVAYAHDRGVLHRDLKPANVLLGPYGETLVVDWGLAKPLPVAEDQTAPPEGFLQPSGDQVATQAGAVVGTPAYMAPEQARGNAEPGPAADIYSLGATLYHLLTGQAPFHGGNMLQILQQAAAGEFPPPGEVGPPVPAPLAAICTRAMAPEPRDRYASAKDLARDIERWLADEPVTAYRDPPTARLRRWSRRHRTLTGVALALLLAGTAGLGSGLYAVRKEERRTAAERDTAQANLKLARQAVDDCFLLAKDHPLLQQEPIRPVKKLLLEKALPFYRSFRARRPDDPAIQEETAGIILRVGYITSETGRKTEARDCFEKARAIYARLADASPEVARYQAGLGTSLHDLGLARQQTGDTDGADRSYREAVRIRTALASAHPDTVVYRADLASTWHNLGHLQSRTARRADALRSYEQALDILQELARVHPKVTDYAANLALVHNNVGLLRHEGGEPASARRSFEEALRIRKDLFAQHPEVSRFQMDLAASHINMGTLADSTGRWSEAVRDYEEARRLLTALVDRHPDVTEYRADLALTCHNLGAAQAASADSSGALVSYGQAIRVLGDLTAQNPEAPEYKADLAMSQLDLGGLHYSRGDRKAASASFQEAGRLLADLAARYPNVPRYRANLARVRNNQGILRREVRDWKGALSSYGEAVRLLSALAEAEPTVTRHQADRAATRLNMGLTTTASGRPRDSLPLFDQAVDELREIERQGKATPLSRATLCTALRGRAGVLTQLGRHTEAAADYEQAAALAQGPNRLTLQILHARTRAAAGDHAHAASLGDELTRQKGYTPTDCYNLACLWACCSGAALADPKLPTKERTPLADRYAAHALEWLRRAADAGYFKDRGTIAALELDDDFVSLRSRGDYRQWLAGLMPWGKEKPKP